MMFMVMLSTLLALAVITVSMILSKKTTLEMEKSSCFECGFNSMSPVRTPFSLQFFLLAILFLIFDVEISLLLPLPLSKFNMLYMTTSMTFLIILTLGLYYEWTKKTLEWK
uniref:NADH-ubiquinone oxidoreductase chain 3 n=1 Tax=Cryptocellus narino TaxID=1329480 RepID=W5R4D1_9ARAC|nr:NADH dehydrogenase subunit 3 [Cryptocellus narino]AGL11925.1 NADH dehydrogenase subunit 3 [Cryptocellus narino]